MIYGFIIAKTCNVPLDFIALRDCAIEFNHLMEENDYDSIAFDALLDRNEWDYQITHKITNIIQDNRMLFQSM